MEFAKRMERFETGIFSKLLDLKSARLAAGGTVVDMSIGAPNLAPAEHVMRALADAAMDPKNYIYAIQDLNELHQAVAAWYQRRYGVTLDPAAQITSLLGSQEGLAHIALTLADEGDVVLVPDPCYPVFADGPKLAGAELVSIYALDELRGVSLEADGAIRIGSLTSFSHIARDPIIRARIGALAQAVDMVGGPQIRNIGTIGGNTCNGVTSADSASTLLAWDALVELTGPQGVRRLPIGDFYIRAGQVDLRPGEIQTAILIPQAAYQGYQGYYIKYAMREAMDIATTGCSVNVKLSADKKTMEDVRAAFGVAGPVPLRAPAAEALARGKPAAAAHIRAFAQGVLQDIHPRDSWRASKDFRQHIAVVMAQRALTQSIRLAGGDIHE